MEFSLANLRSLCEKYPKVTITKADSVKAGNCDSGTDMFAIDNFPNRRSVKVNELVRFIDNDHVQNVLWQKLSKLAEQETKE
jgi:hypothetical protein